jgi:GT2 family glycosyltransferase
VSGERKRSVAAVTINFGPPDDTFDCVGSLIATGYQPLHIIVVDNGSAEAYRERLRRELPAGVQLILSPSNLGFAGGNNLGIRRALDQGAEYVLLINNDATLKPGGVRTLVERAGQSSQLGVLTGKILIADENGSTGKIWAAGCSWSPVRARGFPIGIGEVDRQQYDRPGDIDWAAGCLWLVPADVFRRMGLLPERYFLFLEDADYCLDLRRAGYRIQYDPRVVCLHKVSRSHWENRGRSSPLLNYYTNRNRILVARKWLNPLQRLAFYAYLFTSRAWFALRHRDRSYLTGLWDGLRGVTGARKV